MPSMYRSCRLLLEPPRLPMLVFQSAQGYFLARSRVHYVKEALLHPLIAAGDGSADAMLADATCALLQETYTAAIDRLTLCSSSGGGDPGQGPPEAGDSEASEGCELLQGGSGSTGDGGGMRRRAADAGLLEARRRAGADGGGTRSGQEQQGLVALGRRCLRAVQGSLDEVFGLEAIKQASLLCRGAPVPVLPAFAAVGAQLA